LRLVEAFGGSCGMCGYDRCETALEFHHLDPSKKELLVTSKCMAWARVVDEARKCVMLCSNCHREVHAGVSVVPSDVRMFDEAFVEYKKGKLCDNCPICGSLKPVSYKTCSRSCGARIRYNVDWEKYDLQALYDKIGTIVGVARYIGNVSDNAVRKRMKKEGMA